MYKYTSYAIIDIGGVFFAIMVKNRFDKDDLYRDKPIHPNKKLRISLPLPPSVNHMYIHLKRGGKKLTKQAEEYVRTSKALINTTIEEQRWIKQKKATWYYIDLVFFMPDRRVRDSHNMLKLLLDVMQGQIYKNDYYVLPRIQAVEYDKENPRVEICITPQTINARNKGLQLTLN